MEITRSLAEFAVDVHAESIPRAVRENAILAIADSIGTAYAGLSETSTALIRDYALAEGASGPATIIGTGRRGSATAAALANGAAAHALDFDSISLTVSGFVASPAFFALLAVAEGEPEPVSGKRLLAAFVAGWETEAAIARGVGVWHYSKGWHATATLGHFGAAVAAGRVLGLDTDAMRAAIGITASEASGLRTMVGYMTNPFHVGKAARNGVTAALLARDGLTAHPSVIEDSNGFCVAFNGADQFDLAAMVDGLGSRWDLVDPGLVIKMYPCCGLIHSAIDAALDLRAEHAVTPEMIGKVTVAVHALVPPTMPFECPETAYEAKFSTPFCIGTSLEQGEVKLHHFSDARTRDPDLRRLMGRIEMVVHPDLTDRSTFLEKEFSEVILHMKDGRSLSRRVRRTDNRGSRGRPADLGSVREKFLDCTSSAPDPSRFPGIFDAVAALEDVADVRRLASLLS